MLAVPDIKGGIPAKDLLVSICCAKSPWQNSCKDDYSQRFEAANDVEGPIMLRVQNARIKRALMCRLEGRFTGKEAEEVRRSSRAAIANCN